MLSTEEFTGGIHGMYSYRPYVIRKSNGEVIKDIFKEENETGLKTLIWKYLYEDDPEHAKAVAENLKIDSTFLKHIRNVHSSPKTSYDELDKADLNGLDRISIGKGWIDSKSVHIQYQPYQLGSWAMGATEVVIPLKEIMPYLTDEIMALLK